MAIVMEFIVIKHNEVVNIYDNISAQPHTTVINYTSRVIIYSTKRSTQIKIILFKYLIILKFNYQIAI